MDKALTFTNVRHENVGCPSILYLSKWATEKAFNQMPTPVQQLYKVASIKAFSSKQETIIDIPWAKQPGPACRLRLTSVVLLNSPALTVWQPELLHTSPSKASEPAMIKCNIMKLFYGHLQWHPEKYLIMHQSAVSSLCDFSYMRAPPRTMRKQQQHGINPEQFLSSFPQQSASPQQIQPLYVHPSSPIVKVLVSKTAGA